MDSRSDTVEWFLTPESGSNPYPAAVNQLLIESATLLPVLESSTRDEVLAEILDALVESGALQKKARNGVFKQLQQREAEGSTGLGNGVAVPHVKAANVDGIRMAVAISAAGIPFDAIDGRDVHIMFLVLGPKGAAPEDHLQVLRWVSGLARNADFRRFAQAGDGVEALRDLLLEMTEL